MTVVAEKRNMFSYVQNESVNSEVAHKLENGLVRTLTPLCYITAKLNPRILTKDITDKSVPIILSSYLIL